MPGRGVAMVLSGDSENKPYEDDEQRQVERQQHSLEQISDITAAPVTAGTFGLRPLSEGAPIEFQGLVDQFGKLLELAVEERAYRVDHSIHSRLRMLADRMGFLNAGPRDVIEVHSTTLRQRVNPGSSPQKTRVYAQEGQLLVLELMGYLAAYYRRYCAVPAGALIAEHGSEGREGDVDGR